MNKHGLIRLTAGAITVVMANLGIAQSPAQPQTQSSPAQPFEKRLGRLFTTPDERAKLDKTRGVVQQQTTNIAQTVIVNGVILRPGKTPILFLDGKEAIAGRVEIGNRAQIQARTNDGHSVIVKPGQYVDLGSGRTTEGYQLIPAATLPAAKADEKVAPYPGGTTPPPAESPRAATPAER